MPFGNKRWDPSHLAIRICGKEVQPTSQGKYLGVTIDSKLTFKGHAQQVSERFLRRCRLLASISSQTWGADERILQLTRKALLEPITNYASAAWVPHASENIIAIVEHARNVALRLQTGCCKPTSVERLRELTATDSLREEATKAAAVLLEKQARVHMMQSMNLLNNVGMRKKCRLNRATAKEVGESRLAKLGILPLQRIRLQLSSLPASNEIFMGSVKFFYTDCARSDDDHTRLRKAQALLNRLPHCDVEVWTDGSVGRPSIPHSEDQPRPVSVQWEERWFTATATPYQQQHESLTCATQYRTQHSCLPTHILFYDDGDIHAVQFASLADDTYVIDEDGDRLLCHSPVFNSVGGSGYVIHNKRTGETIRQKEPAGVVCTPFSAEVRAAIHAFGKLLQGPVPDAHYRWILDCQSICEALSMPRRQDNMLLLTLRQVLNDVIRLHRVSVDVVWVSSHCGLKGNEDADKLARAALDLPLTDHLHVPVEFSDARALIRTARQKTIEDVQELPVSMCDRWTPRKAKVVLNQLYTGCCAMFQPLRKILNLGGANCSHCCDEEETVQHFFTCAGRASRRRAHFSERITWKDRILRKPLQVLGYLLGEEESSIRRLFGLGRN